MRNRTRHRRRRSNRKININVFAFISFILSIILVLGFLFPMIKSQNISNESETAESKVETVSRSNEKKSTEVQSVSGRTLSAYSDIAKAEKEAKENLQDISNDGALISSDYFSQNATSSMENIFVRNTTKSHSVNIESYLKKSVHATVNKYKPVVLIYHTHTTESYQLTENDFYSNVLVGESEHFGVVRAGDALCSKIESFGYTVIHDKTVYDTSNSGAYSRSREKISEILRSNPSIEIVIDLHRDSISKKDGSQIKTVAELDGKKIAQIQITTGCEEGAVDNFPNWEKNLTFALHLQKAIVDINPHAARPLLFCARKYNMDLIPCAVNIDIGTQANTAREAVYGAEILGEAVVSVLKECEQND